MASLINPKCAVPMFSMEDVSLPSECGRLGGLISAVVISAIVVAGWIAWLKINKGGIVSMSSLNVGVFVGLLFYLLPMGFSWIYERYWMGYMEQLKSFQAKGQSKKESIQNVQSLYQTDVQASAISSIAALGVGLHR